MAVPSHLHQSALEGIIDFSEADPIFENGQQRVQAIEKFRHILAHFENTKKQLKSSRPAHEYNPPALIRLTFEYARSPESQDKVLSAFFRSVALEMLDDRDSIDLSDNELCNRVNSFAQHLIDHFFLPCTLT